MRGVKVILAFAAVIFIAVAALVIFRKPVAEIVLRQVMAASGIPEPQVRVTELSLNHIRMESVSSTRRGSSPAPPLRLERVDVEFKLRDVISARRVKSIAVGPGEISARVDATGAIEIAGMPVGGGGSAGGALPFDALTVSELQIVLSTPKGVAAGALDATYDAATGGEALATLRTGAAGFDSYVFKNADARVAISLTADGNIDGAIQYAGDIRSPYGEIRNADFSVDGKGSSWRDLAHGDWSAFRGDAAVSARDIEVKTDQAPSALLDRYAAMLGGPVDFFRFSGDVALSLEEGAAVIRIGDRPLLFDASNGARLVVDAAMGDPLFVYETAGRSAAGVLSLRSDNVSATATIDAHQVDGGWSFNVPVRMSALELSSLTLRDMSAVLRGHAGAETITVEATANGAIEKAAIGRFSVADAPVALSVLGLYDRAARTAEVRLPPGNCGVVDRLSFSIAGQDMDAAIKEARLCESSEALAVIRLDDNPVTAFSGVVAADSGRYRLGRTRFTGRPPSFDVTGQYTPLENQTRARGVAKGGSVVLNDLLRFDRADAVLDFTLDKSAMTIVINASQVRMTEYGETVKVAPIFASGALTLSGPMARFDYQAFTENTEALGAGAGEHNINTASGEAVFQFNRLNFAPGGLQPDKLAPVLKGIIGLTRGAAEGAAQFSWDPRGIASRAQLSFDNVTFGGPGLTVTKTIGVNGDIAFSNLWPVATEGPQAVTVDGVDFGALQLERGEILFEMPGDDTLLVERAVFPWFGGEIGVRNATATFTGGNASAPLKVEAVDLNQVLEYIDVEGLSGEGVLNGELPLVVEDSRASFVGGRLTAVGPGRLSYVGNAGAAAAEAGGDAQIAFDILRDLRYEELSVLVDGPLDGRLDFQINFEGTGEVSYNNASTRVPVKYNINLEAALLDILRQANLSRNFELLIETADGEEREAGDPP